MDNKTTVIRARIDENLKKVFDDICEDQNLNSSQVIRRLIKKYVQKKGQRDIFK